MMLLGIDTCGAAGTVALAELNDDSLTLLAQSELPGKTYSARLVPTIRDLFSARKVAFSGLAAIVVTTGPGSFTGIRIGLSTAKGSAEPILAVSRLAVLAYKASTPAAAFDAGRGEFYLGDFSGSTAAESLLTRDQFAGPALDLGPGLAICEPTLLLPAPTAALVAPPTAADALQFAIPRFRAGRFDDPLLLDGNYIRRSDAEIFSAPGAPPRPNPASRT
jgi:tRNA threonylcarbamoyladenosine biosynthesis protein TsaB